MDCTAELRTKFFNLKSFSIPVQYFLHQLEPETYWNLFSFTISQCVFYQLQDWVHATEKPLNVFYSSLVQYATRQSLDAVPIIR